MLEKLMCLMSALLFCETGFVYISLSNGRVGGVSGVGRRGRRGSQGVAGGCREVQEGAGHHKGGVGGGGRRSPPQRHRSEGSYIRKYIF